MIRLTLALGLLVLTATTPTPPSRPPITGIQSVAFLTTKPEAAARFWTDVIGARASGDPQRPGASRFFVSRRQFVELIPVAAAPSTGMLAYIAYRTPDVAAMRRYLIEAGHAPVSAIARDDRGDRWISVLDPDGLEVRFVQSAGTTGFAAPRAVSHHIIHAGHLVRDRATDDRFYRTVLGFRPYWYGGMQSDSADWVSQQVPDGHDWFEYMLTRPGAPVPDRAMLGGMNHVSLGVADVRAAMRRLLADKRPLPSTARPLLGRDGKWQLNLVDPDGTRVELMDFHAKGPPCCSPFTAPDPSS